MALSVIPDHHMECPNGCEDRPDRYRKPINVAGVGLLRRHRCPNCRRVFLSVQKVITGRHAEAILVRLESEGSAISPEQETPGSGPTPGSVPSDGSEPPAS